jgi:hypothetical protein
MLPSLMKKASCPFKGQEAFYPSGDSLAFSVIDPVGVFLF